MAHYWGLGNFVLVEHDDSRTEEWDDPEDVVSDDLQAVKEEDSGEMVRCYLRAVMQDNAEEVG